MPRPPRHAVLATLAVFAFPLTGILALAASFAVDDRVFAHDPKGARRRSRWALGWSVLSFAFSGVLLVVVFFGATRVVAPALGSLTSLPSGFSDALSSPLLAGGSLPGDLIPGGGVARGGVRSGGGGSGVPAPVEGARRAEVEALVGRLDAIGAAASPALVPREVWAFVADRGEAPDGQSVLAFGIVGVEAVSPSQVRLSVLASGAACVALLDVSGSASVVLEVSC